MLRFIDFGRVWLHHHRSLRVVLLRVVLEIEWLASRHRWQRWPGWVRVRIESILIVGGTFYTRSHLRLHLIGVRWPLGLAELVRYLVLRVARNHIRNDLTKLFPVFHDAFLLFFDHYRHLDHVAKLLVVSALAEREASNVLSRMCWAVELSSDHVLFSHMHL